MEDTSFPLTTANQGALPPWVLPSSSSSEVPSGPQSNPREHQLKRLSQDQGSCCLWGLWWIIRVKS